jgi:hypothetical protein
MMKAFGRQSHGRFAGQGRHQQKNFAALLVRQ